MKQDKNQSLIEDNVMLLAKISILSMDRELNNKVSRFQKYIDESKLCGKEIRDAVRNFTDTFLANYFNDDMNTYFNNKISDPLKSINKQFLNNRSNEKYDLAFLMNTADTLQNEFATIINRLEQYTKDTGLNYIKAYNDVHKRNQVINQDLIDKLDIVKSLLQEDN